MVRTLPIFLVPLAAACGDGVVPPLIASVDTVTVVDTVHVTRTVTDTLYVADTVRVTDTVRVHTLPADADTVRLAGALAWGGGEPIGSSSHLAAALPQGRWGIGTSEPEGRLHIRDGELRLDDGSFGLRVTGDFVGENPAGFGLLLDRNGNEGRMPMGITYRQDGRNLWGSGLDEASWEPYPDYVAVFQTSVGDVFRFREGGRALLGNGIGHPEPHHVLTVNDRANGYIANILNLHRSPDGASIRYIRAFDGVGIPFAVGTGGHTGIGKDFSESFALAVAGEVMADGYLTVSDARLKTDVEPVGDVLSRLTRLEPVRFRWKDAGDGGPTGELQLGLLAQEVEKVFPELVRETDDGIRTVDYRALGLLMLRAVQELAETRAGAAETTAGGG